MLHIDKIEKEYPGLIAEMRFYAGDCILKQGSLSGLQMALSATDTNGSDKKYLDEMYIREKIRSTIKVLEGIEHDLDICVMIEKGKFLTQKH